MSKKRNAANLKLSDFRGNPAMAKNVGFSHKSNPFSTGWIYEAPATKIARAKSEKYRRIKK